MSIISSQSVGRQATNNAFVSKLSYATDSDYENAQPAFLVNFPDTSRAHIYYNTTLKVFRFHDGVAWNSIGTGSVSNKAYFHATITASGQSLNIQPTKIVWDSVITDNENKWSVANNQYQVPRDGKYFIGSNFATNSTTNSIGNHTFTHVVYRNNVPYFYLTTYVFYSSGVGQVTGLRHNGGDVFDLLKDDLIDIRVFWTGWQASPSITTSPLTTKLTIIEL